MPRFAIIYKRADTGHVWLWNECGLSPCFIRLTKTLMKPLLYKHNKNLLGLVLSKNVGQSAWFFWWSWLPKKVYLVKYFSIQRPNATNGGLFNLNQILLWLKMSCLDANVYDCILYTLIKIYPGWEVFFGLEIHSVSLTVAVWGVVRVIGL